MVLRHGVAIADGGGTRDHDECARGGKTDGDSAPPSRPQAAETDTCGGVAAEGQDGGNGFGREEEEGGFDESGGALSISSAMVSYIHSSRGTKLGCLARRRTSVTATLRATRWTHVSVELSPRKLIVSAKKVPPCGGHPGNTIWNDTFMPGLWRGCRWPGRWILAPSIGRRGGRWRRGGCLGAGGSP